MAEGMSPGVPVLAVAVSGGRDSTALLHAAWRQSQGTPLQVVALHVHHGLMAEADAWVEHLRRQCARWHRADGRIQLQVHRLTGPPAKGESTEAWARRERYLALATMARQAGASEIWLAHHRRDQAETVLLQALRGAGAAGLAAMPADMVRHGMRWVRPWLNHSADDIDAYVTRHRLSHIADGSNDDARFARNRLRLAVMPALRREFPQAEHSLAAVAFQAQCAAALQEEISQADLQAIGASNQALPVAPWLLLSPVRRRYALKRWLQQADASAHAEALLERLLVELPAAKSAARWPISASLSLFLYRGALELGATMPAAAATERGACDWPFLTGCGTYLMPNSGTLTVRPSALGGIDPQRLKHAVWQWRQGAEQFQLAPKSQPRSLKKQFQSRGVPAWMRQHPILLDGVSGEVMFVPGLGIDARVMAPEGAEQWQLIWCSAAVGTGEPQVDQEVGPIP